ncbi:hypothetical protein EJP617_34170 [Erwinia sp. Ejp617]|nr:hypothetical protein EJP617_34170 [Erwinia sp. Ejp617]
MMTPKNRVPTQNAVLASERETGFYPACCTLNSAENWLLYALRQWRGYQCSWLSRLMVQVSLEPGIKLLLV